PFIEPKKMVEIFGANLLNRENLKHEFNQLIGIEKTKPFECVGTVEEVNTALNLYTQRFPNRACEFEVNCTSTLIEYYKTLAQPIQRTC
ncbi:MAG: hypothetical protein FWC98_05210, partial [Bacteroidales bacterium]|nr:hypothetical protein [Bacteroidales bacterium]